MEPSGTKGQTAGAVRLEKDGNVAVIVIDNPPVNAGSWDVRNGLLAALRASCADPEIAAIVIIGAGKTFVAGADIREFDKPLRDPQMPAVIEAIEACAKPVVAAIRGAALGGGFELALGCDVRIATPDAVVGLPEVTLGIIPGAGGTQRLPRLIGSAPAIEMITSGRRVGASEALRLGLIDSIVEGDLRGELHALRVVGAEVARPVIVRTRQRRRHLGLEVIVHQDLATARAVDDGHVDALDVHGLHVRLGVVATGVRDGVVRMALEGPLL